MVNENTGNSGLFWIALVMCHFEWFNGKWRFIQILLKMQFQNCKIYIYMKTFIFFNRKFKEKSRQKGEAYRWQASAMEINCWFPWKKKKQQLYRLIKIYLGPDTGTSSREIPAISCVVPYFPHRPCSLDFCTVQPTQYHNDTSNRWAVGVKLGAWLKGKNLNITYMNSALMKCWFSAWPLRGLLFRLNAELNIEITKCRERRRSKLPWFFKLARKGPRASALPFKGLHLIRILQQTEIQQNKIKTPERQVNERCAWIHGMAASYATRRSTGRRLEENVTFVWAMRKLCLIFA